MRMISTRVHGILDYTVGIALILAPWLFDFANGGAAMWIPISLGIATILYSLMTNYEMGIASVITMPTHLWIDGIAGLFLALSPWLFGFNEIVVLPHLIVGMLMMATALTTNPVPALSYKKEPAV